MSASDINAELLQHLEVEFLDSGKRAVEFLRTGSRLVEMSIDVPRFSNLIAYCVREALDSIIKSQKIDSGQQWRTASRAVVESKQRFESASKLDDERVPALRELLARIEDMALTHDEESVHHKRLIAVVLNRTGAQPLTSGVEPVRAYQSILERANRAVHTDVTIDEARVLWNECSAILRQLFLPPDVRNSELDNLAELDTPDISNKDKFVALLASPQHLHYFFSKIRNANWLLLLEDSNLLDPPEGQAPWPTFTAVTALKDVAAQVVAGILMRMLQRCKLSAVKATYIARAALDLEMDGREVILRALEQHRGSPSITQFAITAATYGSNSDNFVEQVADQVLNFSTWDKVTTYPDPLLQALIGGINKSNCTQRISLLCHKLRKIPEDDESRKYFPLENGGILEHAPEYRERAPFYQLLNSLAQALRRATEWAEVGELVSLISPLPADIVARVKVWLLVHVESANPQDLVNEATQAIASRFPRGDDAALLDRAVAECDPEDYVAAWSAALGPAPSVAELGSALSADKIPIEWRRAFGWSAVLPDPVISNWQASVAIMAAAFGGYPSRESLDGSQSVKFGFGHAPVSVEELRSKSVSEAASWIAAWRPDPSQWLVSARELGRVLQIVVKEDILRWGTSPLATASLLRHPTYISHYLLGIIEAGSFDGVPIGELVDLVVLVHAHPWEASILGNDNYDFDPDWSQTEQSAVELIKAISNSGAGFSGRQDEVWTLLQQAIQPKGLVASVLDTNRDPLETAINRPHTKALESAMAFLAYEYRVEETVRSEALALLSSLLIIEGQNGAEHRAILASRIGLLRYIAETWVNDHSGSIFGDQAPDGLGKLTIDLVCKWGKPDDWFLEKYLKEIGDSVRRGVENALACYLIAMLRRVPGYPPGRVASFLQSIGILSVAGHTLAKLLRSEGVLEEHIAVGVSFWEHVLNGGAKNSSIGGFGWFAEVQAIDDTMWLDLMRKTVSLSGGNVEWAHKIVERVVPFVPSVGTLDILNYLVRGSVDEWDTRHTAEKAVKHIKLAKDLERTDEYKRLHTTLRERGAL